MVAAVRAPTMFAMMSSTNLIVHNSEPVSEKEGAARLAVDGRGDGPRHGHSVDLVVDADASIPTHPVTRTGKRKRTNAQEPVAINAGASSGTFLV